MVLSVSVVLLLGVLVGFLVCFAALRGWHALLCTLFDFYLARALHPDRLPRPRPAPRRSRALTSTHCPVPQRKEIRTHR
ncbi:MAG TPA: hypothetical protein VJT72_24330 [Pseudonocardiaceae bacterium]|nr:hypothetical protein [Pseudonocardiaceae bacterium]